MRVLGWVLCRFGFHDLEPDIDARFNRCSRTVCRRRFRAI